MPNQVPTGGQTPYAADSALYDGVAKALLGSWPQEPDLAREHMPHMLHYLLGTQLRRHLQRCRRAASFVHNTAKHATTIWSELCLAAGAFPCNRCGFHAPRSSCKVHRDATSTRPVP